MNIIIVSFNKFPNGDAGAVREHTFGKLLSSIGHNVFFVGMGSDPYRIKNQYFGFEYISLRLGRSGIINRLRNYFGYAGRLKNFLKEYHASSKIDVIWVVDIPLNALINVKSFAKEYNIRLIHDSVEWYSQEQFDLGKLAPAYILKNLYNRYFIDNQFKVIAISRFLQKHFDSREIQTVRIPVILDMEEIKCNKTCNFENLILLYAGSPGKKDYLKEIIEGISMLNDSELSQIELRVLGITLEQIKALAGIQQSCLERLKENLKVLGRVPRATVLKNLEEADFTVLLRSPVQRYAKAGFPTKVVESLATATPVILNITSDLGDYIKDMQEGLIVKDCSATAVADTIKQALSLDNGQKQIMRQNARKCAEQNFDYRKYIEIMNIVINE